MEILTLWLWPLLALLLLPGILVYFGLHVVERGIIFVDLALAQVAALGLCVAVFLGASPDHGWLPYVLSLVFTLLGAALFALTRGHRGRVPQEAFIGIIYVVAAAAATLLLSRSAEGDEEIKNLLVGNILLVGRAEVLRAFALFAAVGVVHYLLRDRFLGITFRNHTTPGLGAALRLWDFLFYGTFGLIVTSFVHIAGVYLVFSYLIVPAVCGSLLASQIRGRLVVGWSVAFAAGFSGLLISVKAQSLDLPTGPTIVCSFGILLLVCAAVARLRRSRAATAA